MKLTSICLSSLFVFFFLNPQLVSALEPFNITGYTIGLAEGGGREYLNATNVTIEIYKQSENGPPSLNATLSTLSNESGYFNITIEGEYLNESFMYKINLIKYSETPGIARYIGPNLPYFPAEQINNLGTVYFYLRPAITIDFSAFGNEHVTDDEDLIEYINFGSFPQDYKTGLVIMNNSGVKNYAYVNQSDCLIILNESLSVNASFCELNITDIKDLELGPQPEEIYFINLTGVQKCGFEQGILTCDIGNYTDLSSEGFTAIGGISFNEFADDGGKFFVSALNASGSQVYVYNYTPNFSLVNSINTPNCYIGKMIFQPGGGFGIGNNSGRYVFYKINTEGDFSCGEPVNLTENMNVHGFAYEGDFGNEYYIAANQSGSVNLTQIDFYVAEYPFRYQVKDKKLGYGIKESFYELKYSDKIHIPADRNYAFMIYPEGGPAFPISIELNNLFEGTNISLGNIENRTITSITQGLYLNLSNLNLTTAMTTLNGYSTLNGTTGEQNFTNYTIVAYLFEGGNMVFYGGMLPQNMGQFMEPPSSDVFNKTSGFYNITLPAAAYGADILLFATAKKNDVWYGGFKTITLILGETPSQTNITLYPMVGNESTIERTMGSGDSVNTSLFIFNITSLLENGNKTGVTNIHAQIDVDYSDFDGSNISFSWMVDSGDNNMLKVPLLNTSVTVKIFSPQYPPIKRRIGANEFVNGTFEILLEQLKAKKPDGNEIQNIQFRNFKYKEDGSCSVPWPNETPGDQGCLPDGVGQGGGPANPFTWVISGGKYDMEMRQNTTNITVHYVNVDLLASQPPDAIFDENANRTSGGNVMREAWRFGSMGPNIYDYVIIGIPYNDSAINESSNIKVNITKFHDENWQPLWEQGESLDGLNGTEYEDYTTNTYIEYINGSAVLCNESDVNLTAGLCYKDTAHNMVWFKIPHFSGIEPNIVGQSVSESEEENTQSQTGSSGGSGSGVGTTTGIIAVATHTWDMIQPGTPVTMLISNSNISITSIVISTYTTAGGTVRVNSYGTTMPSAVSGAPSGTVYQYLQITSTITPSAVSSGTLTFNVPASWFTINNLDPYTVTLYRYVNNTWMALATTLVSSNETSYTYTSTTPGFSYFAIVASSAISVICTPGEKRCFGNNLQQCNANGTAWITTESCIVGCDSSNLVCMIQAPTPLCTSNQKRCVGNDLQQCSLDGTEWRVIQTCAYGCNSTNLVCNAQVPSDVNATTTAIAIISVIILIGVALFGTEKRIKKR